MGLFFLHHNECRVNMNSIEYDYMKRKVRAEKKVRLHIVLELMCNGVDIADPEQIYIRGKLVCGNNVKLDVNVIIEGDVMLGDDVTVGANTILRSCSIGNGTTINPFSLVENAYIGEHCFVGPYGRIRPDVVIGDSVQIGNFVEIKNANIASKCRINHLAFIGDADLAENVTIGAGTITCNHDGIGVNRTTIEDGAYIGSGCNLVAPLKVRANSTVASGSTITEDVAGDSLTIARSRQVNIKNWKGPKSRK
jgi:bifunctional UDP-N-acetylglucosamine pyrophosphorylase/glucosamine-1-phosphate N-acetyltransferase